MQGRLKIAAIIKFLGTRHVARACVVAWVGNVLAKKHLEFAHCLQVAWNIFFIYIYI